MNEQYELKNYWRQSNRRFRQRLADRESFPRVGLMFEAAMVYAMQPGIFEVKNMKWKLCTFK
jgi:hypothetical protein